MKFIFSIPGFDRKSNGLNVFHRLARDFKNLGAQVKILPWSIRSDIYTIPKEYQDLYSAQFDLSDAIAFLPDAIPQSIADDIKSKTKGCVWWLCNAPGLLGHEPCYFDEGDILLSFSNLISTHLPSLYYHAEIEGIPPITEILKRRKGADLVLVYTGKGSIHPIPSEISNHLPKDRSKIVYISRFFPETKEALHSLLNKSKFMICFDPISNLTYEATLFGTPVFMVNNMRPNLSLQKDFNVPLHGIFTNVQDFISITKIGLDLQLIHNSHQQALEGNCNRVKKAYDFLNSWYSLLDQKSSPFLDFNTKIAPMYRELAILELKTLKPFFDINNGSTRNLTKGKIDYIKNCVERPKHKARKRRRNMIERIFFSLQKKWRRRIGNPPK